MSVPRTVAGLTATGVPAQILRTRKRRRPSGEPPPLPRQLNASGKWWLVLTVTVIGFWVVAAAIPSTDKTLDVFDHRVLSWLASLRAPPLTSAMTALGLLATGIGLQVLWLLNGVTLLIFRRWRHLLVLILSTWLVSNLSELATQLIQRPRPIGISIIGHWHGYAMPSRPMAVLAAVLVGTLYASVPAGTARNVAKWVVGIVLAVTMISRLYLAQDGLSDAIFGVVVGVAIPLALFRLLASNNVFAVSYHRRRAAHVEITDQRRDAIVVALQDQLGVLAIDVKPFGLEGSGGSTPLRVKVKGDPDTYLFCKLYTATHMRSDRWYKLGRTLLYGRLEDEASFNSVRRLVQYEDYVLRLLQSARLPVSTPYGIVEITPEREYLLVTEFFDGAVELGDAHVDDAIIDQGLLVVRRLWDAGLAHRDIKPANLLVRNGQLHLIDPAFAEVRPSPWRQAVDLANMMLVLALRTDAQRVYDRALAFFMADEIAEAFAATRGLTMPSQLRRLLRQQGRDLHGEFTQLLPARLPPVKIQRWSVRRVALTTSWGVGALIVALIGLNLLRSPL
jgi:membrane-associated phospholipid phosphatase/tRNA A-37 threonylcarbamoyl transferase component Bud32